MANNVIFRTISQMVTITSPFRQMCIFIPRLESFRARQKHPCMPNISPMGLPVSPINNILYIQTYINSRLKKLFDISSCQCAVLTCGSVICSQKDCNNIHGIDCICSVKVPKREVAFLLDQRGPRQMYIGPVDSDVTSQWDRARERETKAIDRVERAETELVEGLRRSNEAQVDFAKPDESCDDDKVEVLDNMEMDTDYEAPAHLNEIFSQNRTQLPNLAQVCDRYCVSNRAKAAMATGVLIDYDIITEDDKSQVIGPKKLETEGHRYRMAVREKDRGGRDEIIVSVQDLLDNYHRRSI